MPDTTVAPDQPARDRITADLDHSLFVEAGAGSGKTTALVERVVALVACGHAELRAVAAITFTEKAGAELRDRLRKALEERAAADAAAADAAAADAAAAARCRAALDQLDGAAIGTLHAFAQRLLGEHPVEAGLPPRVEVHDEVTSGLAFTRRWSAVLEAMLADPALERTLLLLAGCGVQVDKLAPLAAAFDDNWDLVYERVPADAPEPPPVAALLAGALGELLAVCARRSQCSDLSDKYAQGLERIERAVATLQGVDDELELLDMLGEEGRRAIGLRRPAGGSKKNWPDLDGLRASLADALDAVQSVPEVVGARAVERLGSYLRRHTLDAAEARRRDGRLEFHDLLVLARELVRHPRHGAAVRRRLHERYARILLDEFQDTDPIQIELAVRIAAADPESEAAGNAPWPSVPLAPGHLFVVGDPKQSIYRFRRADISLFLAAREHLAQSGSLVQLQANFRAASPVIDWVNRTFGALMVASPGDGAPSQAPYLALHALRPGPAVGPAVSVIGRVARPRSTDAAGLRTAEASDVADTVARIVTEGWSVHERAPQGERRVRPARLGDITVLVPARTSLPFLEDALEARQIPYRAEASSLVYATRAVRDLLMVLRAADDPTDHLAIVAALRTPLLRCGDDDLFRFKVERRGRWDYLAAQPDTVPAGDPVAAGLALLGDLHREARWRSPSELLERIAREGRAFEVGFADGRPRDLWRRLRYVVDQARAWADASGGTVRDYLAWVSQQSVEGARVAEAVLPETDDDAVRVMTVHAAKGLEFPITIVSGMTTAVRRSAAVAQVVFPPGAPVGYRLGSKVRTEAYEEWKPVDEQMGHDERVRLLYVACTRAADHLVVSLHRKEPKAARIGENGQGDAKPSTMTSAELLVHGMGAALDALPDAVGATAPLPAPPPARPSPPAPFDDWQRELTAALARSARPTAVAATALTDEGGPDAGDAADGLRKRPRDLDLPPWLKGRYGTAVGRAVHGTLQSIELATGDGLDAAVASQCEAEAIPSRSRDVRALVTAALASPSVVAAARSPHWREVYACVPIGGRLLEGYVDLLYRDGDGLVVVDYKTAATDDDAELARRVEGYRLQGASYAVAIADATGEEVRRVTFVFLTPSGAVERDLDGLDEAVARARALVTAGGEVVVDEP